MTTDETPITWGLASAFELGVAEPIEWIDVECKRAGLILTVPRLPLACTVNGQVLRPSLSYAEQVRLCRILGCVSPTYEWYSEIWSIAAVKLTPHALVQTPADALKMGTLKFLQAENAAFERQLDAHASQLSVPDTIARGFCKLWIVHPKMMDLGNHGACNVGFRQLNGADIQTPGGRHNDAHLDYSQWAWDLPRRAARDLADAPVDLLALQCKQFPRLAQRLRIEYDS